LYEKIFELIDSTPDYGQLEEEELELATPPEYPPSEQPDCSDLTCGTINSVNISEPLNTSSVQSMSSKRSPNERPLIGNELDLKKLDVINTNAKSDQTTSNQPNKDSSQVNLRQAEASFQMGGKEEGSKKPRRRNHQQEEIFEDQLPEPLKPVLDYWNENMPFSALDRPSELLKRIAEAYPSLDAQTVSARIAAWWEARPEKRKTKRGIPRFINSWFSRENDKEREYKLKERQQRQFKDPVPEFWGLND
jgi:hypothetical protein